MKSKSIALFLGKNLTLIFFLTLLTSCERDYHITGLDVSIHLQSDGSMRVQEDRQFTFEGTYTQVFRTFPLDGKASFSGFEVFEGEKRYELSEEEEPGTMRILEKEDFLEVQWFFEATDTVRTFSLHFLAEGAIERYEDVAVLYYQVISEEWEKPTTDIGVEVHPPTPAKGEEIAFWWHGSLDVISEIKPDGRIQAESDRLPAGDFLEVRAMYPEDQFYVMPVQPGKIREEIMEEAAQLVKESNRMRQEALERKAREQERHQMGSAIFIPISLVYILFWLWYFRRFGSKPQLSEKPGGFSKLPSKEKPALVSRLMMSGMTTGNALVATLFDLAYRGFLKIEEKETTKTNLFGKEKQSTETFFNLDAEYFSQHKAELRPFEEQLLNFLFRELGENRQEIPLSLMKKKPTKMQKFFRRWQKSVKLEYKKKNWVDKRKENGRNFGFVISGLMLVAMIILTTVYGPLMLVPAGFGFLSFLACLLMNIHTEAGEMEYRRWKSLKGHLKRFHFDEKEAALNSENINGFLIYGVALGLGKKYFRNLTEGLEASGHAGSIGWIVIMHSPGHSYGETISRIITTTSTTMSSSSGAGGGGTVGGGGGAASGGGGAR